MESSEYQERRHLVDRAVKIFGRSYRGGAAWPYGLENPFPSYRKQHPDIWEQMKVEQPKAQRVIVEWADRYELKRSDKGCCPRWLQRNASRSCHNEACGKYGSGVRPDYGWLDHHIAWLFKGKPAAITSAPYGLGDKSMERLDWWQREDPRLSVAIGGEGWYGHGSIQVLMWRSDRIETMVTAPDAVRGTYVAAQ